MKITLEFENQIISHDFNTDDVVLDELYNAFKCLCLGATYQQKSFDNLIKNLYDDIFYQEKQNT